MVNDRVHRPHFPVGLLYFAESYATPTFEIEQAAEVLSVSGKTVHKAISSRKLTACKLGNEWRIAPEQMTTSTPTPLRSSRLIKRLA